LGVLGNAVFIDWIKTCKNRFLFPPGLIGDSNKSQFSRHFKKPLACQTISKNPRGKTKQFPIKIKSKISHRIKLEIRKI
jgi:hypothetical protein